MKLRIKKGAVVKFELIGTGEPIYKVGKVIDVCDDEVVLVELSRIKKKFVEDEIIFFMSDSLEEGYEPNKCHDIKLIHINRAFIVAWEYENIKNIPKKTVNKDSLLGTTFFDSDGFCKGNGEDFSNVLDSTSSYIVIGKKNK